MKHKFFLFSLLLSCSMFVFGQNSYLTVSELITEYNNLDLASGTTASGTYTVRGYVTLWQNGYPQYQNASFYIDDSENGSTTLLQCFRLTGETASDKRKLVVGDYVEIQNAQLANYYGSAELKNGSFTIISNATPAEYKGETTIADFLAQADLKNIYQLTGVVSGLTEGNNKTYGNLTLTDETGSVYVYGVLDANGQSGNFASLNVENDDTLTIRGTYALHNNKIEITDAQYISHHKFVEEPAQFMGATAIANFLEKADTKNIYQLTGVVDYIYDNNVGDIDIFDESGNIHISSILTSDSISNAFSTLDVSIHDTITINATLMEEYGSLYVYNAVFVKRTKYVAPPVTPFVCQCGDDVYYSIDDETSTLTLHGTGPMWENNLPITQYPCSVWISLQHVIVEEGVTTIAAHAFSYHNIESLTLPSTLERIGKYAFAWQNLTSINIPANVNYIDRYAFWGCPLTDINVSAENQAYSSIDGVLFDKEQERLFIYPENKVNDVYTIPNSVKWIDHAAFYGNKNIISVSMGNNVEGIGIDAFAYCEKLISITLSDNLTFIGSDAIHETALVKDDREWENGVLYIGKYLIDMGKNYNYPDPVVPDSSNEDNTSTPQSIRAEQQDTTFIIKEGTKLVAMYASDAIADENIVKKIAIPSSIEYVNPNGLVINSLTEVVWNAKHCHDFEITIPVTIDKDSSIVYNPFYEYGITGATSSIKKISFAKDVEYIPAGLCSVMPNLEEVYNFNPEPINIAENTFDSVGYTCILYVPKGSKTKYEAAPVWKNFYRIREMDGPEGIGEINDISVPIKFLLNGQVYILRGDKIYTLQGQEVK